MRATQPFLLLLSLLAAALIALNPLTAVAAGLVFADGRTWTDVKMVSKGTPKLVASSNYRLSEHKPQSLPPFA